MSKDPAFLFYPGDWLGGTMTFTRYHKGAYMDLLMAQHMGGHMSVQDIIIVLGQKDFDELWEQKLKCKFLQDSDGKFYNERLEREIIKRKKFTESRRENLLKTDAHMEDHMDSHMDAHMDNRNRNRYSIKNKKEKIFFRENVELTQKEYDDLTLKYTQEGLEWMMDKLSAYKESSGHVYKSDAGAIRSWVVDEWLKKQPIHEPKMVY